MSYFSEQDIDTRTCGQADDDAWLDRRDGLTARSYTRDGILAGLATQRANCDYAARPALDGAARAEQLFHLLQAAKRDQRWNDARVYAAQLKPLLSYLPEGV